GEFVWEKDVQPQYFWFNGHTTYQLTEPFDPNAGVVEINSLMGSPDDGQSRIYPFKVFRGVQPYDAVNNTLVVPHLFGKDENAYWKSYDWDKAIAAGMEYAGLEYSGQYDWVETAMYWPITHMVAPAEQAVQCGECHTRTDSRMDGIPGIYAPGHDYSKGLDAFGWGLAMLSLVGVVLHGGLRIAVGKK
ncbi:MAG: cytochrome C, partial [Anaerolineae bacterium]